MPANDPANRPPRSGPSRLTAVLIGVCVAQAALLALAYLGVLGDLGGGVPVDLQEALRDERMRARIVGALVERGHGMWDTHNDADVGRVLQPGLAGRKGYGSYINSNRYGMREDEYAMPKPEGTTRVVLVGDSFVFGEGIDEESRVGVFLERELEQRAGASDATIEVLHLGVGSWDVVAEAQFVRRQLSYLRPDLVIHFTTANDLDDSDGVRGFGAKSSFSPRRRQRADSRVLGNFPGFTMGVGNSNRLLLGTDWESRSRYALARDEITRLKRAVEAMGGRYLCWNHWGNLHAIVRRQLTPELEEEDLLYNSLAFFTNREYWVGPADPHWNAKGNRRMAQLLYGAIQSRDLLPGLELEAWDEALAVLEEEHGKEWRETVTQPPTYERWEDELPVGTEFDMARLEACSQHVNGGVDREGRVSPYASITMRAVPGGSVTVTGRGLPRLEIAGVEVAVFVEELRVGTLSPAAGEPFEETWPLPAEVADRELVAVRFEADDWAYEGRNLQHCVVFELERITVR